MKSDLWSVFINIVGWLFFLIAIPFWYIPIIQTTSPALFIWLILYPIIYLVFWPIQISYHILVHQGKEPNLLRRIDRGSMLFAITSFFSPIIMLLYNFDVGITLCVIIWVCTILGMILLLVLKSMPRKLAPILAFLLGIVGIITILSQSSQILPLELVLFIIGGVCLIGSGIVYAIKHPDPKPNIFGFHEIFHTLFTIGVIVFYFFLIQMIL